MEKQQSRSDFVFDDDLPPPYEPMSSATNFDFDTSRTQNDSKAGNNSADEMIISQILDAMKSSLSCIESAKVPPTLVESTFVPALSVGPEWSLSDPGDRTKREVTQVFRISVKQDKQASAPASNKSTSDSMEFDEWGRFGDETSGSDSSALWWADETMARRLVKKLQFEPSAPRRATTTSSIASAGSSSRNPAIAPKPGLLAAILHSFSDPQRVWPPPPPGQVVPPPKTEDSTMSVRAEEVTFRRENEMGIWESKTGWGLVIRFWPKQS